MKPRILPILFLAAFLAQSASAVLYLGNGRSGFGGPVGSGSLEVTDDGVNLNFTFNRGTGDFNDTLVIYFDSDPNGAGSLPTSGEVGESIFAGRRAVVNEYGSGLVFGPGFQSDYAFSLRSAGSTSNHLFTTPAGANANTIGFITTAAVSNFGSATASSYTWTLSLADLGLNAGDSFSFVTSYGNPSDGFGADATFRSNEAFGHDPGAANPGFDGVTISSALSYTTVPEPAFVFLGGLGLLLLLGRRK